MDYLIIFLIFLKDHLIFSFLIIVSLGLIAPLILPKKIRLPIFCCAFIFFSICFINVFMGHILTNFLIDKFGTTAEGVVLDITKTSNSYNDAQLLRYDIMINPSNEDIIPTYCLTSDYNITYNDSSTKHTLLQPGVKLNVKYIKNYPRAFVIIADKNISSD